MADNKSKEKKGLKILLLIILFYALLVVGVAIYVKLDKSGYFGFEEGNTPIIEGIIEDLPADSLSTSTEKEELELTNEKDTNVIAIPDEEIREIVEPLINDIDIEENAEVETESTLAEGLTIADVPARARPDSDQKIESSTMEADDDEVLSASDLVLNVEKPKGFFERIFDTIKAFFANLFGDKEASVEIAAINNQQSIDEINAEIEKLKSKFIFEKENNGMTWIDHINKPNSYIENGFYIYMGLNPEGRVYHRTVIRYSGAERIGLKSILVQSDINDRALIVEAGENLKTKEFIEDNKINEWVDLPPTKENNDLLNTVVKSNVVKLTFMGVDNNIEWTLSDEELSTLRESLYFYDLLKEKEVLLNSK